MRIDIHAHYFPEAYLDLLERFSSGATDVARNRGAGDSHAELEARLELMDSANVQVQVLSVSPQLPYLEDEAHAVEAARQSMTCTQTWYNIIPLVSPRSQPPPCPISMQRSLR